MKYLLILSLTILSLSACKKNAIDPNQIITEPPENRLLSSDTTISGQKLGFIIGKTSTDIYATLQIQKNAAYLNVVGNIFTSLDSLANRLTLYNGLLLDEKTGTSTGIQINFEANKVKSIYTNDGVALTKWPASSSGNVSVAINDAIGDIYQKLVNIKQQSAYANKFERISIFAKDVAKAYDPQMGASPQWYLSIPINAKAYNLVFLNFKAGVLVSVYSSLYQSL